MRIGFDGTCLSNRRGFGRFSRMLLQALGRIEPQPEIVVFLDKPSCSEVSVPDGFETILVEVTEAPTQAASAEGRRRFRDIFAMGKTVSRARLDLMYFPTTYTFYPVWGVKHLIVTLHDTLALAHPELVFPTSRGRFAWLMKEHVAVRMADRVVTVSETSRRELQAWFNLSESRIRVVSEGPAEGFRPLETQSESDPVLNRYGIPTNSRFLLYVGGLSPHKNLIYLVKAFARMNIPDVNLVLVGDLNDVFHTHVPLIFETIEHAGLEGRVLLPGFVPDSELVALYNRAYALVLPSLMEGFGLPAVEAMACGTPVVASRAGSLPEVVGDAGLFFDPRDINSMTTALRGILGSPERRNVLGCRAVERASHFTWDRSAEALIDTIDELAPIRPSRMGNSPRKALNSTGHRYLNVARRH